MRAFRRTTDSGRILDPMGLRGVRRLDLRRPEARHGRAGFVDIRARRYPRRHLLAATKRSLLDP